MTVGYDLGYQVPFFYEKARPTKSRTSIPLKPTQDQQQKFIRGERVELISAEIVWTDIRSATKDIAAILV
jgi:hypothetical protein